MTETNVFDELKLAEELRNRLQEQFPTIISLAATPPEEVMKRCEISKSSALRAVNQARKHVGMSQPTTAAALLQKELKRPKISTSSQHLDEILGGGVSTGDITEFSGAFATGKTQISFQLCLNVQRSVEHGGLEGKALFIDTENTFAPTRVAEMSYSFTDDPGSFLQHIFVHLGIQ